jgi:hypothetical protein
MDIVFIEQSSTILPSSVEGAVVPTEGIVVGPSHTMMTYEGLLEKIFSSEHIIVV